MAEQRHRAYCFTVNNYTQSDEIAVKRLAKQTKFLVVGRETGEAGTPHFQGFAHFINPVSFKKIKELLPRAHIEVAMGSDQQNLAYCEKQGDLLVKVGEPSQGQGSRTDLKEIAQKIKGGDITIEDLMFDYPEMYVRYSRSFEKMFNAVMKPRTAPPEVHWIYGKAGVGKTRKVFEKHTSIYPKDNTPWWDGYKQQEAIVMDDFDDTIPFRTLLRILDRYEYQGQVKGGYVQVNSPFIYITCEFPPSHFYGTGNTFAQVKRRLTSVQHIDSLV